MKYLYSLMTLCLITIGASAQKTAYINFQQLVAAMPESKKAGDSLQKYADQLNADGQVMVAEYTKNLVEFDSLAKTMTDPQKEIRVTALKQQQANIQEYKYKMEEKVAIREQELLTPIVAKAKDVLKALLKEKGYALVLDNSRDAVVVANEADDLLPLAKAKLGIK
ncbi:OmpH family outer membrane protein [Chitinophaga sp. sic0106]|uniref:OmpH family outer membrane protein n=1 Tax=Chitinophaga sp. sic0106 TaxID=2854785 RepID=UPI001C46B3F1|nr:OmpH family outer membrane protein [Chitinophaga sp. sic0106]MBV7529062.1 OmpH family outer membrane protein [Chitinophaga sp. sic0106]